MGMSLQRHTELKNRRTILLLARSWIDIDALGICSVINKVGNTLNGVSKDVDYLKRYISSQLEGEAYLEGWLRSTGNAYPSCWNEADKQKMFITRLAWLDWMIKCYDELL